MNINYERDFLVSFLFKVTFFFNNILRRNDDNSDMILRFESALSIFFFLQVNSFVWSNFDALIIEMENEWSAPCDENLRKKDGARAKSTNTAIKRHKHLGNSPCETRKKKKN